MKGFRGVSAAELRREDASPAMGDSVGSQAADLDFEHRDMHTTSARETDRCQKLLNLKRRSQYVASSRSQLNFIDPPCRGASGTREQSMCENQNLWTRSSFQALRPNVSKLLYFDGSRSLSSPQDSTTR